MRSDPPRDIQRPPILRDALPQIVETVRSTARGEVELTLNPEELGRIRLSMSGGEAGLQVTIQSDRAETAELLRRHIALLRDELAGLGYAQVDIGFGGRHGSQPQAPVPEPHAEPPGAAPMVASAIDDAPGAHRPVPSARLDMRL